MFSTFQSLVKSEFLHSKTGNYIQKITWKNKLSLETTNLKANKITEIQIFHVELKLKQRINSLINVIDKSIPYPIIFIISFEKDVYLSTSHKRNHPLNEDNALIDWCFETDWILIEENIFSLNLKKGLDEVFLDFCSQLTYSNNNAYKTLDELVEYDRRIKSLLKDIEKINLAIKNCNQFNKKV